MRRLLALAVLLLQACDKPPAPSIPSPVPPPQGKLRLDRSATSSITGLLKEAHYGYPSLVVRMTYGGPNTYVEREMEVWHEGKRIAKERGHQSFQLPLSDDAAFGFSDGKDGEGKEVVKFHDTYPVQSKVPGAGDYSRASGSFEFGLPSLKTHPRQILEPAFPLEIVDGTEALLWAVFVDEPAELPAGATPEERAKRAGTAFLFRVRTADGK